jgi:Set1/Ash2 histone methyltransferase complex subunit ASH2
MQAPSDYSPPQPASPPAADTPASAAQTPSLPDTPASAHPDTPFSDATPADASDAGTPALAPPDAPADGDDEDGINASGNGVRKHMTLAPPAPPSKKSKKKGGNSVWTRPASRKGKKKAKQPGNGQTLLAGGSATGSRPKPSATGEEEFLLVPAPRLAAERSDDAVDLPVLLSRVFKSERVELSDDRLTASSTKGYRMVRATRGVAAGAWYFEVKVVHLGPTGHTRLGWATNRADLQTPVGYDAYGFGYRDIDGAKVHKAWREKYADEGYGEADVLGFYISLPDGERYEPKQPDVIQYRGVPCHVQVPKDELKSPGLVPGEHSLFSANRLQCQLNNTCVCSKKNQYKVAIGQWFITLCFIFCALLAEM